MQAVKERECAGTQDSGCAIYRNKLAACFIKAGGYGVCYYMPISAAKC